MDRKCKILLAEDEEQCNRLFCRFLETWGYLVVSARDGAEAWSLYEREDPDLLLSDVDMPRLSGLQLLNRIRERDHSMPAILVSGMGDPGYAGVVGYDFVDKPVDFSNLRSRIENAIAVA